MDLITLAMAKTYADSKQPVVVDLDKYNLGQTILGLFAQGGGQTTLQNIEGFWDELSTDREVQLKMAYSVYTVDMTCTNRIWLITGKCGGASCGFTLIDNKGVTTTVNIGLAKDNDITAVSVVIL